MGDEGKGVGPERRKKWSEKVRKDIRGRNGVRCECFCGRRDVGRGQW